MFGITRFAFDSLCIVGIGILLIPMSLIEVSFAVLHAKERHWGQAIGFSMHAIWTMVFSIFFTPLFWGFVQKYQHQENPSSSEIQVIASIGLFLAIFILTLYSLLALLFPKLRFGSLKVNKSLQKGTLSTDIQPPMTDART